MRETERGEKTWFKCLPGHGLWASTSRGARAGKRGSRSAGATGSAGTAPNLRELPEGCNTAGISTHPRPSGEVVLGRRSGVCRRSPGRWLSRGTRGPVAAARPRTGSPPGLGWGWVGSPSVPQAKTWGRLGGGVRSRSIPSGSKSLPYKGASSF